MGPPDATTFDTASPRAEDALERHFSGKRTAERVACVRPVEVEGAEGRLSALVHDLSETGFLVEIVDGTFAAALDEGRMQDCLEQVRRQFGGGLRVWFPDAAGHSLPIVLDAEIVRMTLGPGANDGVRLGCRLLRTPSDEERRMVGMEPSDVRQGGLVARPGRAPNVLVYGEAGPVLGPLCAARLVAVDGRRLSLQVTDAPEVSERLFDATATHIVLARRGRIAWAAPVRLVEVRRGASSSAAALAVEMECEAPVGRRVLRDFRPA
jgi:hypothetical protein